MSETAAFLLRLGYAIRGFFVSTHFDHRLFPSPLERRTTRTVRPIDPSGLCPHRFQVHAYERMFEEAWKVGINLQILSATRNFDYQRGIWERKWDRPRYMGWEDIDKAVDIMTYSSMPGTSRHHWGTDIDLCSLRNDWFASAEGARVYDWLNLNAWKYGFRQVYSNKEITGRTGYNEEKWHWSYMPLSSVFLDQYNALVLEEDIEGFLGSEVAGEIGVITDYVNGVED